MHRTSLPEPVRSRVSRARFLPLLASALVAACGGADAQVDRGSSGSGASGGQAAALADSAYAVDSIVAVDSVVAVDFAPVVRESPAADTVPRTPADSMRRGIRARQAVPDTIRGLYVNRWAAIGSRMWQLTDIARRTEVNALVIDVKDDRGLMLYRSEVPLVREMGADTVQPMSDRRLAAMFDSLHKYNVHPIARIVVVKDPILAEHLDEWAIRRRDDPSVAWLDRSGKPWLDPHQHGVWQYAIDIAREAVRLGFAEIQLDYVRFPDERRMAVETTFPLAGGRNRAQVIREMLGMMRDSLAGLGVPITADVFGLTGTDVTDMGIGQRWESFIDQVDVVLPMMYPSHYAPGTYGFGNPNANPYGVIDQGLKDIVRRSEGIEGAAHVVPWYQDFTLGAPRYGAEEVRAQIRAGYDNGFPDWILWNPGSRYNEGALEPLYSRARAAAAADSARAAADSVRAAADSIPALPDSAAVPD